MERSRLEPNTKQAPTCQNALWDQRHIRLTQHQKLARIALEVVANLFKYRFVFKNRTNEAHPLHFHRARFELARVNGKPPPAS
jgi:hypothetical protein